MELEEMKSIWGDLSGKVENQEKIKKEELMKMTRKKYQNSLGKIYLPEILGSVISFIYAAYFITQFERLQLPVNQVFVVFNTAIMIILPTISLITLYKLNKLDIVGESPMELLQKFKKNSVFFRNFQKVTLILSGMFAITILPPLAELLGRVDMISNTKFWIVYVPIGLICVYIFGSWAFRKYDKALQKAQDLLEGIE
ncbi:hypothetical protein [Algoriphagus sp. PAP.12]|uniref:hypothetical protein n=1 Tax=Algoriphagus sp. PAP.12 TaxID=2996678 RepID=UPI00227D6176|nr:hypothetical protein [Algoriphagus sp. PAP.12]